MGFVCVTIAALAITGCRGGQLPDPNDPKDAAPEEVASVLKRNIDAAADSLDQQVRGGRLSDGQRRQLLAKLAGKLVSEGDPKNSSPQDAWIYADLMITAGRYDDAIPLLRKAVDYAKKVKNDDRRVNDSLRLARALAMTGHIDQSFALVQSVIDSHPVDPAPILFSVLLEITPAAEGKGHDLQLAKLLEEAIHEHLSKQVNPNTDEGKAFILTRPHHIRTAWLKIISLLMSAKRQDLASAANERFQKMMEDLDTQSAQAM